MKDDEQKIEPEEGADLESEGEEGLVEELGADGEEVNSAAALKKLREKLKVCQAQRDDYLAMSQRLKADHVNSKREVEGEKQELIKFAKADLLVQLLDVADSFELAMANQVAWETAPANWRQGVEYIYAKLKDIFRQNGLETIGEIGVKFDPARHESVGVITGLDKPADTVVELVNQGYQLNGRVIRPAKVKISHE